MKKFSLLALTLLFTTSLCVAQGTTNITKFKGQPINGLIVNGAFEVRLSQGEESSARVELLEELKDKLTFEYTEEGYIRLDFKDDITKYLTRTKNKPTLYIVVDELKYLSATGACSLIAKGKFSTAGQFTLRTAGTSYVTWIDIKCQSAGIDVTGSSKLEDITVTTPSDISLTVSGTSSAAIKVDCAEMTLAASGTTKTTLGGRASGGIKITASGSSVIDMLEFDSPRHTATLSEISKIRANVSGMASVTMGKLSSYRFTGSGTVTGSGAKRLD